MGKVPSRNAAVFFPRILHFHMNEFYYPSSPPDQTEANTHLWRLLKEIYDSVRGNLEKVW
jgi:hypothetical protein